MDGQADGQMDGGWVRWMDRQKDGWNDGSTNGRMGTRMDGGYSTKGAHLSLYLTSFILRKEGSEKVLFGDVPPLLCCSRPR